MRIFRRSIEEFQHAVRPRLSREIKIKTSAEVVPSRDTQSHRVIDEEKLDSGVCKRKKLVSSSEPVSLETYFLKVVEIGLW